MPVCRPWEAIEKWQNSGRSDHGLSVEIPACSFSYSSDKAKGGSDGHNARRRRPLLVRASFVVERLSTVLSILMPDATSRGRSGVGTLRMPHSCLSRPPRQRLPPPSEMEESAANCSREHESRRKARSGIWSVGATVAIAGLALSLLPSVQAFLVTSCDTSTSRHTGTLRPPIRPTSVGPCRPLASTALQIAKQQLGEFEVLDIAPSAASDRAVQVLDYCGRADIDPIGYNEMWDVQKMLLQGQLDRVMEVMKLSKAKKTDDTAASAVVDDDDDGANRSQFLTQSSGARTEDSVTSQLGKDTIIMLQHKPVYTLGTGSDADFIKDSGLSSSIDIVRIERGGEVTYHGPGQLVAYPILDLKGYKQDIHWYMRALEEAILLALDSVGVEGAVRENDVTGIWIGGKKVAALGVKVRRWITMHGLAVNVDQKSLGNFDGIVPCGLVGKDVTCINDHLEHPITVQEFAVHMRKALEQIFEIELVDCPLVETAGIGADGSGSGIGRSDASDSDPTPYQPPQHTSSFLEHLGRVKSAWPDTGDDAGTEGEGIECTGEPSIDPSRTIQASQTDDSNWM